MRRWPSVLSALLSVLLHLSLLVLARTWTIESPQRRPAGGGAIAVELASTNERAPAPRPQPPRVTAATVLAKPRAAAKARATVHEGVKLASRDDVRRRLAGEHRNPEPAPAQNAAPAVDDAPGESEFDERSDEARHFGEFHADTPGYDGRIFGQVSVRNPGVADALYGRIHLFRAASSARDYSDQSLFGYSFRERLGEVATRTVEAGRVHTPGAYLMVTDLFADGHLSTMSHTVLFAFPRIAPAGADLYDVVDETDGDFRLRGPAGSFLLFDGRSGGLRRQSGFVIASQGDSGAPRVGFRGLHLRLEAVGSNPFLRDRPATAVDALGQQCSLSTSELFQYDSRRESDVLRFADDADLFAFLRERCPALAVPQAAPPVVAKADARPLETKETRRPASKGLLPMLFHGFH